MDINTSFSIGDVITVQGPSVPKELWAAFWRVTGLENDNVQLSNPYLDEACTKTFYDPMTRAKRNG